MQTTAETFGDNSTETIWGEPTRAETLKAANDLVVFAHVAKATDSAPHDPGCMECLLAVVAISTPHRGRVRICSRHLAGVFYERLRTKRGNPSHAD